MRRGQRHGTLRPECQGPLGVTDTTTVEGQIDDQVARGRAAERSGGAVNEDGPEDRDFHGVSSHAGERSPERCVGAEGFEPSLGTV